MSNQTPRKVIIETWLTDEQISACTAAANAVHESTEAFTKAHKNPLYQDAISIIEASLAIQLRRANGGAV